MTEPTPIPHAATRGAPSRRPQHTAPNSRPFAIAAAAIGTLALSALYNRQRAKQAERDNPPAGRFVEINGVRMHYVERGQGEPLVLLHGNGSMVQDFESSSLLGMAAHNYRGIACYQLTFSH